MDSPQSKKSYASPMLMHVNSMLCFLKNQVFKRCPSFLGGDFMNRYITNNTILLRMINQCSNNVEGNNIIRRKYTQF